MFIDSLIPADRVGRIKQDAIVLVCGKDAAYAVEGPGYALELVTIGKLGRDNTVAKLEMIPISAFNI